MKKRMLIIIMFSTMLLGCSNNKKTFINDMDYINSIVITKPLDENTNYNLKDDLLIISSYNGEVKVINGRYYYDINNDEYNYQGFYDEITSKKIKRN